MAKRRREAEEGELSNEAAASSKRARLAEPLAELQGEEEPGLPSDGMDFAAAGGEEEEEGAAVAVAVDDPSDAMDLDEGPESASTPLSTSRQAEQRAQALLWCA